MRMRFPLLIPAILATTVLLAGCDAGDDVEGMDADLERLDDDAAEDGEPLDSDVVGGDGPEDDDAAGGTTDDDGEVEVAIVDNAFIPEVLEVGVGDTVTWVNEGSQTHTVAARDFESTELAPGDVFAVTFGEAGTVPYECTIHDGMSGEIVVE